MEKKMNGQIELAQLSQTFDINHKYSGKPNYKGFTDEICRYSIELDFELAIPLDNCSECNTKAQEMFRSCEENFVECPKCKKRTNYFRHMYQAKQAWKRGEYKNV